MRTAWRTRIAIVAIAVGAGLVLAQRDRPGAAVTPAAAMGEGAAPAERVPPTRLGINLSRLEPFVHQQVFANLILQSQWFTDTGHGWAPMPEDHLDARGWITHLDPGQVAPKPLVLPAVPFGRIAVRCLFKGSGALSAGGIAELVASRPGEIDLMLTEHGDDGAWVQLDRTDPADPVRDIDCRDSSRPAAERFAPEFLASLKGFDAVRFLDWQPVNDNPRVDWDRRTRPDGATAVGPEGVSVEDMIDLANQAHVDPWFLMPYQADDRYISGFARLVHDRLAPGRTAYVELGNEVWNDAFAATQQAREEGLALRLAPDGDPTLATMRRYAQKTRETMRIWTAMFADRPARLVRVASTQHVNPDLAEMILGYEDLPRWIDALATAPYIHLDLTGRVPADADWVFSRLDASITEAMGYAAWDKRVAARYGKRYIAYEGGQHLVTGNMQLAHAVQRDPRMADVYRRYLSAWQARIGDRLMLYASTSPISEDGAWGLREYAGQPASETPKLRAVRAFLAANR